MNETELKHVIALLLEDAKRLQQLEPNAGTGARSGWLKKHWNLAIMIAKKPSTKQKAVQDIHRVLAGYKYHAH